MIGFTFGGYVLAGGPIGASAGFLTACAHSLKSGLNGHEVHQRFQRATENDGIILRLICDFNVGLSRISLVLSAQLVLFSIFFQVAVSEVHNDSWP